MRYKHICYCSQQGETRLLLTRIPHFREVCFLYNNLVVWVSEVLYCIAYTVLLYSFLFSFMMIFSGKGYSSPSLYRIMKWMHNVALEHLVFIFIAAGCADGLWMPTLQWKVINVVFFLQQSLIRWFHSPTISISY